MLCYRFVSTILAFSSFEEVDFTISTRRIFAPEFIESEVSLVLNSQLSQAQVREELKIT